MNPGGDEEVEIDLNAPTTLSGDYPSARDDDQPMVFLSVLRVTDCLVECCDAWHYFHFRMAETQHPPIS